MFNFRGSPNSLSIRKLAKTSKNSHPLHCLLSTRFDQQPNCHFPSMNQHQNLLPPPIDTGKRLEGVKQLMRDHQVSIYVVPTEDAHGSEYICPADARREYITGFTGSAGTALILLNQPKSLLFTDGRYFNQASKQLHPSYWKLMKQGLEGVPTWQEYLIKAASDHTDQQSSHGGLRIGIDPTVFSVKDSDDLSKKLKEHSATLVSLKENLVDIQWASARPARPHNQIKILELKYSGQSTSEKLAKIRDRLSLLNDSRKNLIGVVVSALDEVAWCLNLRGCDIVYNPVFFSYLWIGIQDQVILFINEKQLDPTLNKYLADNGVETRPYDSIWNFLQELNDHKLNSESPSAAPNGKVLISPTTSLAVENHLGGDSRTVHLRSPLQDLKAIKNATEIEGFRNAHLRDGVALVTYFAWLQETLLAPHAEPLNEYDAALQLERFRKQLGGEFFQGLSFDTISSSGKNAAIIHYSPPETDSAVIDKNQVYLCDSGAQYLDGTTDVTRTWVNVPPSHSACSCILAGIKKK
jgi:Xaa-Pro aminopeptidase